MIRLLVRTSSVFLAGIVTILSGCARAPQNSRSNISELTAQRTGTHIDCSQNEIEVKQTVSKLIQNELTLDSAIQISLINNRSLQAQYQEIGISHAELVQAGLLRNPLITAFVGFPNQSDASISTQFSLSQNFIDLFSISRRKSYAQGILDQTELHVANAFIDHIASVEKAYYQLQAEMNRCDILKTIVEIDAAGADLSLRQSQAGNVYSLEVVKHKKELCRSRILLARCESKILVLREQINELLGLWGMDTAWTIPKMMPDLPAHEIEASDLEQVAISNRLDLRSAKKQIELSAQALGLKEWWTYIDAQLGVIQGRDNEGISSLGPTIGLALPLFDCGQAERAKLSAKLQQSIDRFMALSVSIRADVKAAAETLLLSRELVEYIQTVLIPLQKKSLNFSQKLYNSMSMGAYELLHAKREEMNTQIEHIEALNGYLNARVELGRIVGGKLLLNTKR